MLELIANIWKRHLEVIKLLNMVKGAFQFWNHRFLTKKLLIPNIT